VGQLISEFNDRLASRILDIEWRTHGLDQVDGLSVCWLVLGSEARKEQPLNTDQDNALIYRVDSSKSEINIRTQLLAFAQNVNRQLDLCGLELCGGGVMAGNPDWCHSLDDWINKIKSWNANAQPESILAATIFFDFRGIWGDLQLEHELRSWLVDFFRGRHRLIHGMAASALGTPSPIGLFSRFLLGSAGAETDAIDLKSQGSRIFVDAARVESLMLGLQHVSTETRLRQVGHLLNIPIGEVDAMVASFVFILRLRLRLHLRGLESPTARLTKGEGLSLPQSFSANNLKPSELNKLERETLREAFKQSRLLQKRLAMSLGI
jgi:CBS domain-containing protein